MAHVLNNKDSVKGGKKSKRSKSMRTRFKEILDKDVPATLKATLKTQGIKLQGADKTTGNALTLVTLKEALSGEAWAVKMLVEQLEGKPVQRIEHTGDNDNPFNITISKDFDGI